MSIALSKLQNWLQKYSFVKKATDPLSKSGIESDSKGFKSQLKKEYLMEQLSREQWNPNYSSNLDFFDIHNRRLINLINQIQAVSESGSGEFLPVIKQLVHFLTDKFHEENVAMMVAGFAGREKHIAEHLHFVEKIEEFLLDCIVSDPDLGSNMLHYLQQWAHEHIAIKDVQFGEYLQNRPILRQRIQDLHRRIEKPPALYVVNA